jgi:uncharacterized protein with beta-barrel porin domain
VGGLDLDYGNKVIITGGTVKSYITGGGSNGEGALVNYNSVSVSGSFILENAGEIYGGSLDNAGTLVGNKVTIEAGTFGNDASVYGGTAGATAGVATNVTGNIVEITGGSFSSTSTAGEIVGGYVLSGSTDSVVNVTGNQVSLKDANFTGDIIGGFSALNTSTASKIVTISGNSVTLENTYVEGDVYGATGENLNTNAGTLKIETNTVTLKNAIIELGVYAGSAKDSSNAASFSGNNVIFASGTNDVGLVNTGDGGTITIEGTTVSNTVNNTTVGAILKILSGTSTNTFTGAVTMTATAPDTGKITIANNTLTTFGSTVTANLLDISGGTNNQFADVNTSAGTGNVLTISNGSSTFNGAFTGGSKSAEITGGSAIFNAGSTFGAFTASGGSTVTFASTGNSASSYDFSGNAGLIASGASEVGLNGPITLRDNSYLGIASGSTGNKTFGNVTLYNNAFLAAFGTGSQTFGDVTLYNNAILNTYESGSKTFGNVTLNNNAYIAAVGTGSQTFGAIVLNDTSTLVLDYSTISVASASFASGTNISADYDGSSYGKITSPGLVTGAAELNLYTFDGDLNHWVDQVIIEAGGTSDLSGFTVSDTFFELSELTDAGKKLLKVLRRSVADIFPTGGNVNYINASNLADRILNSSNTNLANQLSDNLRSIMALSGSDSEQAYKQFIGETVVNIPQAAVATAFKTQGVVFNRLDRIREVELENLTPPAAGESAPSAGSGSELNRLWAGGFGVWADADDKDGVSGYEYKGGGMSVGYDRKFEGVPGLRLGLAMAFANGNLDNNDGLTKVDIDTFGLGLYGSYILPVGLFFDANVAFARSKNDYTISLVGGGTKTGAFDVDTWQL